MLGSLRFWPPRSGYPQVRKAQITGRVCVARGERVGISNGSQQNVERGHVCVEWFGYVLCCNDPALPKAPFLAMKNAHRPDRK